VPEMTLRARKSIRRVRGLKGRRRTELGLLALASLIIVATYTLMVLGNTHNLPADATPLLVVLFLLVVGAHVANRLLVPDATPVILPIAFLLNGIGYIMIVRIDLAKATKYAPLQLIWTAIGVGAYVATLILVRRSRDLDRYRYLLLLGGVVLLLMPLVPGIGLDIGGARLWVHLGPVQFQPVELAKILLCIFFASYFAEKREILTIPTARVGNRLVLDPRPLVPITLAWVFAIGVMSLEHDIGFSALLFTLFIAMLWVTTGRFGYLILGVILFAIGAYISVHFFSQTQVRVNDLLDPWKYANGSGRQLVQAWYSLGSGGLGGSGLGIGQGAFLIPVANADFIFAVIGEEMGLLGSTMVVAAFLLIVGTGLRIAQSAKSEFAKLTAVGLTVIIGFQAFFIIGGVVRILPLTGITLPFVSYGGSALVANYILIAVLMRMSDEGSQAVDNAEQESFEKVEARRRALVAGSDHYPSSTPA
jgi:cell division protein FtsW (lipid II flippase)